MKTSMLRMGFVEKANDADGDGLQDSEMLVNGLIQMATIPVTIVVLLSIITCQIRY